MLTGMAPPRRRLVLGVATIVALAVLAAVAVLLASMHRAQPAAPVAQDVPGPVLLVPGYGGSTASLDVLANLLRAHGKDVAVLTLPGDGRGDLNAQAAALGAAVATELARTHVRSVDVVGYSAGGVVARLWVREHGGARAARRVVTLGSPHHGTELAGLAGSLLPGACPIACQQLEPNSSLLDELNAGDQPPAGPSFVSIWTTHDDVVLPPNSASIPGALDFTVQSVCAGDPVRHSGLPSDPVVGAIVLAELAPGPPVAAPRVSCPSS